MSQTAVEDACDRDRIGEHKGHELEGNYCVEGHGRADVDEGEQTGDDAG